MVATLISVPSADFGVRNQGFQVGQNYGSIIIHQHRIPPAAGAGPGSDPSDDHDEGLRVGGVGPVDHGDDGYVADDAVNDNHGQDQPQATAAVHDQMETAVLTEQRSARKPLHTSQPRSASRTCTQVVFMT